jgi:hypothetical protein
MFTFLILNQMVHIITGGICMGEFQAKQVYRL